MSIRKNSVRVPFKVISNLQTSHTQDEEHLGKLLDPDYHASEAEDNGEKLVLNGWQLADEDYKASYEAPDGIYADLWHKGELEIHTINESPYRAGGEDSLTIFSNKEEALLEFMEDFKKDPVFKEMFEGCAVQSKAIVSQYI